MTRLLALAVAAAFILTGCSGSLASKIDPPKPPEPQAFSISGTVTVEAGTGADGTLGGDCFTDGGYSDIRTGAQVTVTDATGTVVALGSLDAGHTSEVVPGYGEGDLDLAAECVFGFKVAGIPENDASFYSVEVSHRGKLQYARTALNAPLEMSLGDAS